MLWVGLCGKVRRNNGNEKSWGRKDVGKELLAYPFVGASKRILVLLKETRVQGSTVFDVCSTTTTNSALNFFYESKIQMKISAKPNSTTYFGNCMWKWVNITQFVGLLTPRRLNPKLFGMDPFRIRAGLFAVFNRLFLNLRTALFWVITPRVVVISNRRFGTTYRPHLQGPRI